MSRPPERQREGTGTKCRWIVQNGGGKGRRRKIISVTLLFLPTLCATEFQRRKNAPIFPSPRGWHTLYIGYTPPPIRQYNIPNVTLVHLVLVTMTLESKITPKSYIFSNSAHYQEYIKYSDVDKVAIVFIG